MTNKNQLRLIEKLSKNTEKLHELLSDKPLRIKKKKTVVKKTKSKEA